MNPSLRNRKILELLEQQGELTVEEACEVFDISEATARRALNQIASEHRAEKTWGGLKKLSGSNGNIHRELRKSLNVGAKQIIARAAAALIEEGDVIAIDGGTTTLQMAPFIANRPIRIITNSILVAHEIDLQRRESTGAEVFLTGGMLHVGSGLLVGPETVKSLKNYNTRRAFISAGGIDADGITNTTQMVVEGELAMMQMTEESIVLADSSKWGRKDMVRLCDWSHIDRLITESSTEAMHGFPESLRIDVAPK